jgi:hypothetical protein
MLDRSSWNICNRGDVGIKLTEFFPESVEESDDVEIEKINANQSGLKERS